MNRIFTLTVNPLVDKNIHVTSMLANRKLRCSTPIYRAGGGGINVSRALKNLGVESEALFFKGGKTGHHLEELMTSRGINCRSVPISGSTRENLSVFELNTQQKYLYSLPGPTILENEWKASLNQLRQVFSTNDYLIASGKICPGMPLDYYVRAAAIVKEKKGRFILDTSGGALLPSMQADIFLLKPNLAELSLICGEKYISYNTIEEKVLQFMVTHNCKIMVISLGGRGALLVQDRKLNYIPTPFVTQKNIIGAGDSMVAGMVFGLLKGMTTLEMAQFGVACGAAATMREGTRLCLKEDAEDCYSWIKSKKK